MKLKTMYTTSNFKSWKEKVLAKMKRETTQLKQTKPVLSTDFKKHLEEGHPFFLSPLIKHQTILHLYIQSTTFRSFSK